MGISKHKVTLITNLLDQCDIDPWLYCLNDYAEESACVMERDGEWWVFDYERGHEENCYARPDLYNALRELFHRIAASDKEEEQLLKQLEDIRQELTQPDTTDEEVPTPAIINFPAKNASDDDSADEKKCALDKSNSQSLTNQ